MDDSFVVVGTYAGTGEDGPTTEREDRLSCNLGFIHSVRQIMAKYLLISDNSKHVMRVLDMETGKVVTVAGNGEDVRAANERQGPALRCALPKPAYILEYRKDSVLLTSSKLPELTQLSMDGQLKWTAGTIKGFKDGPLNQAQFRDPAGGCLDPISRSVFIADRGSHVIRIISPQNEVSSVGIGDQGIVDGDFRTACFSQPSDVCPGPPGAFL